MGTRNLTCVLHNGELVVAKYCQWDGHIYSQGKIIIEFIKNKFDKDLFIKKLKNVKQISTKELKKLWTKCGADPNSEWVDLDVGNKFGKKYPHLERDMGGKILEFIQSSKGIIKLDNDKNFAKDSLFCEYCYVLNLDEDTLDIYTGFCKEKPSKSIFFDSAVDVVDEGGYYPVNKLMSIDFKTIKRLKVDTIVNKAKKEQEKVEI